MNPELASLYHRPMICIYGQLTMKLGTRVAQIQLLSVSTQPGHSTNISGSAASTSCCFVHITTYSVAQEQLWDGSAAALLRVLMCSGQNISLPQYFTLSLPHSFFPSVYESLPFFLSCSLFLLHPFLQAWFTYRNER